MITSTGIINLCMARSYEGLRDRNVKLLDMETMKTYDLWELIRYRDLKRKGDG